MQIRTTRYLEDLPMNTPATLTPDQHLAVHISILKWQFRAFLLVALAIIVALAALWKQSNDTARAMRQQSVASVYALSLDTDKLAIQTPAFRKFFAPSADYFTAPKLPAQQAVVSITPEEQEKRWREGQLASKKEFDDFVAGTSADPIKRAAEEAEKKTQVWASAGYQSDYMEYIFVHRELYEDDEWKGWWQFLCQEYDDSPILRQFLARYEDTDWYTFLPAVRSTIAGRQKYYDKKSLSGRQQ